MAQLRPAVHRTILAVDVERFGDPRRNNHNRVAVRAGLCRALESACQAAGIPWSSCRQEVQGDGVLILAPPEIPKALFVESLPGELVRELAEHNGRHRAAERIRLRMAVNAGEVNPDDHGFAAQSINMTFRLLEARPFKDALASSDGVLALIVSSWFFDEVVRHGITGDPATYRPVWVAVKETRVMGWMCLPDNPFPADETWASPISPAGLGRPRSPQDVVGVPVVVPTGQLPERVRGRDLWLRELRRACRRRTGVTIVLAGMGGVGKSTIAAVFADRARRARFGRPRTLVWWVSAADRESLTAGMVTVARQLGAPGADIYAISANAPDAADRFWALLSRARRGWLLVFDNVDEPTVLGRTMHRTTEHTWSGTDVGSVADGTGWLRPTRRGLIVVTSRDSSPVVWGRHARVLRVDPLPEHEAAQVLLDQAPAAGDDAEARRLARRLGGLPLALRIGGSYLGSELALRTSFRDYRHALEGGGLSAFSLASAPALDTVDSARAIVASTWELSLDALDRRGVPQARPLLRLLSCYALATPIPLKLLRPEHLVGLLAAGKRTGAVVGSDVNHRLERGLDQLRRLGLIDVRSPDPDRDERGLVVHPVVADTNRFHLLHDHDGSVDVALVCHTAVELVAGMLKHLDHERATDWPTYRIFGPHVHALLETIAPHLDRWHLERLVDATVSTTRAMNLSGAVRSSERLLRAALDTVAGYADDDLIRLKVLQDLAWPVASLGRSAEAEAIYREVYARRRVILGEEHPETLRTRHELAWVAAVQRRYAEAEQIYREVLAARQRILGSDHPYTLITHHELGWAIASQSRGAEAWPILLDVLRARRRVLGDQHPRTLKTFHELAWVMAAQGRWDEAEASYRALLDRALPVFGAEHPDMLTFRHELAWILAERGDRAAAIKEYRGVLDARHRILGDHHPDTIATRIALDRLRDGVVTPAHHWA